MDPLFHLTLATVAFIGTHFLSSTSLRMTLVEAIGERAYLGTYSAVSFITIGWMSWAYGMTPVIPLFEVPGLRLWPLVVMPFALILIAAGVMTRNPSLVGQQHRLKDEEPARGIVRVTRHPVMWGIALWSAVHLLARGDAGALVFFGGFLFVALAGTRLMDARKADAFGEDWKRFASATSNVPFTAIVEGRNRLVLREIGWKRVGVGLALYAVFLIVHPLLFGRPAF
jgi:uncharacterized membrane protein